MNESKHATQVLLVGVGDAGRHHARALNALQMSGELAWVGTVARSADTYRVMCHELGQLSSKSRYQNLDDALETREFDVAIIATPDQVHHEQIIKTLALCKAVLAEKPLVENTLQAEACYHMASQSNQLLRAGYHHRFHAGHQALKQELPHLGDIEHVELSWSWQDPNRSGWRAKSGQNWAVSALGIHLLDFAGWLTDQEIIINKAHQTSSGESAEVWGQVGKNTSLHMTTEVNKSETSKALLFGNHGAVACLGTFGARGTGLITVTQRWQRARQLEFEPVNPYQAQLQSFLDAYRNGFEADSSLIKNVEVIEAINSKGA
jgi:predicted dehydrogenase